MILDAHDPGPLGDFPNFPRNPDGTPLWSDTAAADGTPVDGVTPMPRGLRTQAGKIVDLTPRSADGSPLNPLTRLP